MTLQQQEAVEQKRNERIHNARFSLTTTKKVLCALFVWMWVKWVANFNIIDSLRHENDSISLADIKYQQEQQHAKLQLYIDTDDDGDVSTKIARNSGGNIRNREDSAGRQESRNVDVKNVEHSQHRYCAIGLTVSRLAMGKYLLIIGSWISKHVSFHYFTQSLYVCIWINCRSVTNRDFFTQPNDECLDMLSPHLKGKRAWHFMGDSQMGYTFLEIGNSYPYPKISNRVAPDERCGFLEYCGLQKRSEWDAQGAQQTQGPIHHGFQNHFCSDLSNFKNTMYSGDKNNFIEYLAVEYASDVEQQTPTTNTTQQTTSLYLKNQLQQYNLTTDDRVCVVNAGIHDQNICWMIQDDKHCSNIYMKNVETYLKELDSVCGYIVWISITSCSNDVRFPQDNRRSIEWNRGVESLMNRLYPEKSFFVDVWEKSSNTTHVDNVHFEASYYREVASLFTSLV